jgi:hypothetical protein
MNRVPRPGDNVHIPLDEHEALRLMLKVKPTKEMPRPGKGRNKSVWDEVNEDLGLKHQHSEKTK